MPIVPLFGHEEAQQRLREAARRRTLPSSLLIHGPRGVGKQRLALWLAQLLLCEQQATAPCGTCRSCRFAGELTHPDLHWFFPRPRPKDSDPDLEDVRDDYAEAIRDRVDEDGLYEPPSGMEGLYVATVRAIVQQAALSPAIGARKVFVIGDAERMASQEGSEQAANAFLKLLEEPPDDTTIILTSSEAGSLLPTIRSRVVSFAAGTLNDAQMREFLAHEAVGSRLKKRKALPADEGERLRFAAGAPGRLLAAESWGLALDIADRMLDAASNRSQGPRYDAAWSQASNKARGAFADTLDALTEKLHGRARDAARRGADGDAIAASRAVERVEAAKEKIIQNVSPQLITVNLIRELQELLT
jgi:DNA polymerase III subunit delta'